MSHRIVLSHFYSFLNPPLAQANCVKAVALAEKLVHDHPGVADYDSQLALALGNLATFRIRGGRAADGEVLIQKALAVLFPKTGAAPTEGRHYGWAVTTVRFQEGLLHHRAKRTAHADASFKEAISTMEELVKKVPIFPWRLQLTMNYPVVGEFYEQLGRADEAEAMHRKAYESAHKLQHDFPTLDFISRIVTDRRVLFLVYPTRRGERIPEIIAEIQKLEQIGDLNAVTVYNLACIYALAAAKADTPLRAAYSERAMEMLYRTEKARFFNNDNVRLLKTDADLNSLRQRDDFQALQKRVSAPHPSTKR